MALTGFLYRHCRAKGLRNEDFLDVLGLGLLGFSWLLERFLARAFSAFNKWFRILGVGGLWSTKHEP